MEQKTPLLKIQSSPYFSTGIIVGLLCLLVWIVVVSPWISLAITISIFYLLRLPIFYSPQYMYIFLGINFLIIVFSFISLLLSLRENYRNTYTYFYDDYLHHHRYHRNFLFLKPKIENVIKKYSEVKNFRVLDKNQISITFKDGKKIFIDSADLESHVKTIRNLIERDNSNFSIVDLETVKTTSVPKIPRSYYVDTSDSDIKSLKFDREHPGRFNIIKNNRLQIGKICYDINNAVNPLYEVFDNEEKIVLRGESSVPSSSLPANKTILYISDPSHRTIATAIVTETPFATNDHYSIHMGEDMLDFDMKGLVKRDAIIQPKLLPFSIKIHSESLPWDFVEISTDRGYLPKMLSFILGLVFVKCKTFSTYRMPGEFAR